jgi:hypothetical protein
MRFNSNIVSIQATNAEIILAVAMSGNISNGSGGARKNIEGGPTKYTLIYKHKFFCCNKR